MRRALALACCAVCAIGLGCGSDEASAPFELTEGFGAKLDEQRLFARILDETLEVRLPLARVGGGAALSGEATVELVKLGEGGGSRGKGSAGFTLGAAGAEVRVVLKAPVIERPSDLGGYTLHYRVSLPGGALRGRRSLYMAVERRGVAVIGNDRFVVGVEGVVRVLGLTTAGAALPGVPVRVTLRRPGGVTRELVDDKTDQRGELQVRFTPTADEVGGATLWVRAGSVERFFPVQIEGERSQLLLTTDKPLYQPGQTVHMRALAMRQPQMVPLSGQNLTFEIIGPTGTKLLAQPTQTDAYGIASHRFALPTVLGLGRYALRATVGDFSRERSFTVERYVLPKFKLRVATGAAFYPPSAKIAGWVQVDYLFGKPVKQATVRLRASAPPSSAMLWEVIGKTNAQGRFDFDGKAPAFGTKLLLSAEVEDGAGAVAKGATSVVLSGATAKLQLIAERSTHLLGQQNRYFVLVTTPAGAPRGGKVTVTLRDAGPGAPPLEVDVPASGIARFALPPSDQCPGAVHAKLETDEAGLAVRCSEAGELRIDTDKAIYGPGEVAKITLAAPAGVSLVMLEVLRQNASLSSVPVTMVDGAGALDLPLGADLSRTLTLRAYSLVGPQELGDQRLIHVVAADQLQVAVTTDKASYRPAEQAKITLQLRDAAGKPAPGAIGVQVVDEALFGLTDVKPGIERRTFHLDQELVEAGQGSALLDPGVLSRTTPSAADQLAAQALFAAAGQQTTSPIHYRSFDADLPKARSASARGLSALMARLKLDLSDRLSAGGDEATIQAWVAAWLAARQPDDFGQPLQLAEVSLVEGSLVEGTAAAVSVRSAGMDERSGTADDLSASTVARVMSARHDAGPSMDNLISADGGLCLPELSAPKLDMHVSPAIDGPSGSLDQFLWPDIAPSSDAGPSGSPDGSSGSPDAGGEPTAITRERFPETLYVDPALITDAQGKATIDLALADSITSWRLTSIAHTKQGQLGSAVTPLKVFQPFFVDVLLPTHLLQGDTVKVPVAVYNYLETTQTVTVDLKSEPWFELLDQASKQLAVPAKGVASVSFELRAKQNGRFTLSATGRSASDVDAVKRSIRVLPDGLRKEIVRSGVLKPGTTTETLSIPLSAIDGASELHVKVYPGRLAEVVAGFESMLETPHGCFEQSSSATYPNVMVLRYLRASGQVSKTFETQALVEIGEGYAQLAGYEVGAGGFSLWGKAPADLVVTAYGLMLFAEMAKVHYVDPALIERMQTWLVAQRSPSGTFAPLLPPNYYGIPSNAVTDELRTTAYVTWALATSGYTGSALTTAAQWLRLEASKQSDPYGLALAANALLTISPKDPDGLALVSTLKSLGKVDGDALRWESAGSSLTYGHGASMTMETTALVAGALLLARDQGPEAGKALRYLTQRKSALGGYGTTQATVLTLRALILAASAQQPASAEGSVEVRHNGQSQGSSTVTLQNADVTRLFDLKQVVIEGNNTVDLLFTGKGELAYQVVATYYEPHGSPPPSPPPFTFSVSYDKESLALAQQIVVSATLTNTSAGAIPTTMMRVGLPPGFTVDLTQLLGLPGVNNAERDGPFVVLYLGNLSAKTPQTVSFPITPTLAATGRAPASSAYPYYTPEYLRVVQTPIVTVAP